ncbi:protease modulator HflK [Qipengyuania marisflavi]|uniref:Protease modulator HflK n=2 Tax=Qipengyuania marisflavi TaxID=2486356 RepID=A0A5S3P2S0_9SPHN|nr:protease modulator HflK [Qipengyuania marisflavi]
MAGKRNPWGKGSGGEPPKGDDPGGDEPAGEPPAGDGAPDGGKPKGPKNPWLPTGSDDGPRRAANIEDIFKHRGPEGPRRKGGGGGPGGPNFRLPERPGGKSWFPIAIVGVAAVWLFATSIHQVAPREQGVVTWLGGQYARNVTPGLNWTAPWPLQVVDIENVSQIRSESIPGGNEQKLILTGDQNLVDLSYLIRWNIKDLKQFRFQLIDPEDTIREVAEAAMRASVAEQELDSVLSGEGRAEIEARVMSRMQSILDGYRAGVAVQGIEIEKTDPPNEVVEAFKDVSAAQQDAETAVNSARAYAQRVLARAQGDAAAFDKIYAEYKLAPEVTRRRLYYETMESVLGQTDKTIVETSGVTTYLPLPEVKRRSERTATPPTIVTQPEVQ